MAGRMSTIGTTTDTFGRPVVSKPAGASNDIVHVGSADARTVSHTGDPLPADRKATYILPDRRHLLTTDPANPDNTFTARQVKSHT